MKPCYRDLDPLPPSTGPVIGLNPAQLCALAWVRSNFPQEGGPDILSIARDGCKVTVDVVEEAEPTTFLFRTELAARRAIKQIPTPVECVNDFMLATNVDLEELQRAMNFGHNVDEMKPVAENVLVLR